MERQRVSPLTIAFCGTPSDEIGSPSNSKNCGRIDSAGVGGLHGLEHEHEDIRAFTLPLDAALARLARGEIVNANAVMTLQWLALNRARLQRAWA